MEPYAFGVFMRKYAADMFNNNRAAGTLQPGQRYVGGQLVSGPGAKPLTAEQKEDVAFANAMRTSMNALNASAGGVGRRDMMPAPAPTPKPTPRAAARPAPVAQPAARPVPAPAPVNRAPTAPQQPAFRKLPAITTRRESPDLGGSFE